MADNERNLDRASIASAPFVLVILILFQPLGCNRKSAADNIVDGRNVIIQLRDEDISAAVFLYDKYLLLGSDEKQHLYVLPLGEQLERLGWPLGFIQLPSDPEAELDIEAIAADGSTLYVAGSHSNARTRADGSKTQLENRERITTVRAEENRARIFRVDFDLQTGTARDIAEVSLMGLLQQDEILGPFTSIASKENGVDIEGLAVKDGKLYVGFRSPVLRDNYVPIVRTSFDSPERGDVLFVDLDGLGIRDLVAIPSGFLVLAGPSNDAQGDSVLYYWTGEDGLAGRNRPDKVVERVRQIETPQNAVAEGLAVLASEGRCHELLVVFDGPPGGAPQKLRACRPR